MKKRNLTAIIIASSMMLALAGCGVTAEPDSGNSTESEVSVSSEAEAPEDEGTGIIANKPSAADASDATFEYNGKTVSFTDSFDTIKSALGEPSFEDQAPTSDDPKDKMYTFGDDPDAIDVSVIDGKTDSIIIYDSNIKTSRGVSIGNTDKDVISAYGEGEASKLDGSNEIDYDFGDYTLIFFLEKNNTVKAIGYAAN
ncbi:MAG: hypothetical protein J5504_11840 [Butyrivibrio sp.]|nr:hypothetical protein [Butyrivibrio sp.]